MHDKIHSDNSRAVSNKNVKVPKFLLVSYMKIEELYNELQDTIESLESKIETIIEKDAILSTYKEQLSIIQHKMLQYKGKLDDKECQSKQSNIVVCLKESLSFFKNETGKLAETVAMQKNELTTIKIQYESLKKEHNFLESNLKKTKKDKQLLQIALIKAEKKLNAVKSKETGIEANIIPMKSVSRNTKSPLRLTEFITQLTNSSKDQIINQCKAFYQELAQQHNEITSNLRLQLMNQRKTANKVNRESIISRTELEQLFYECAEEARRSITNRRTRFPSRSENYSQDLLSGRDKIRIMENFMCNDKLLRQLHKLIFSNNSNTEEKVFGLPEYTHRKSVTCSTKPARYRIKAGKLFIK